MVIDNKFDIGQLVYLITDNEQKPRIITGVTIGPNSHVTYRVTNSTDETWHYEMELTDEENIEIKVK